jgi:type I restriction enzyme, S subunit
LLEGLEISEITFEGLQLDNEKFRLDDEFFQKKFIQAYALIKNKSNVLFGSVIETLSDYHANGSYEVLNAHVSILNYPDYAYMVRSTDLEKQTFQSNVKYVTQAAYNYLSKTKLYGGEILINKIGNPGAAYLMPKLDKPATVGMNLFMLRLKNTQEFNQQFVWAFLNSGIGQKIIRRKVNGTVPLTIDKAAVRSLYLPKLDIFFQENIQKNVLLAEEKLKESQLKYTQAETLLLQTIGLTNLASNTETVNIKSFKDSFVSSGRLDAEYYQPKYEDMVTRIRASAHICLGDAVMIQKSIEPGTDAYVDEGEEGLPFLRVADFSKHGLTPPQKKLSQAFVNAHDDAINLSKPRSGRKLTIAELKPRKDAILFSKDGSVGEAYCLREDANYITSGAVLHLTVKDKSKLLPDYLALALNSVLVRTQAERDAGGSIILHWRTGEIANVVVPLVDFSTQQKISTLVQQSFKLKAESEQLLAMAKRAIEIAIEQDEQAGMAYMTAQTKNKATEIH